MDSNAIVQAVKEFEEETFRTQVELHKIVLRQYALKKRWWHKLFPFKITIERINK